MGDLKVNSMHVQQGDAAHEPPLRTPMKDMSNLPETRTTLATATTGTVGLHLVPDHELPRTEEARTLAVCL